MKAKRFGRTRAVGQAGAIALVTCALVFAAMTHVINRPATRLGKVVLTASTNFSITSSISSSSSSQIAALLYPGTARYLWYTAHNPFSVPITVDSMSIGIPTVTTPAGCSASNLDLTHTTFSGSLVVPAHGANSVAVPISLKETGASQQLCKSSTFSFTYAGTATYTEVYNTSTVVASSLNPSAIGQSVTYTATVTGIVGAGQDPLPNSPTGKVTFKDGATTICAANISVTSASATTSTAQCTPPTYSATGTHPITAVFTNTDGNFTGSTASALNQVVKLGTSTALVSAPNPSIGGTSVTLTATVTKTSGAGTPTGSVSFFSGSPSGTHALLGTGTLNSSAIATFATSALPAGTTSIYAVYAGDASFVGSTSPVGSHLVIALPSACAGTFTLIMGNPGSPTLNGTNGNDFIYAVGANYIINAGSGNDCVQVGDGNNNITTGNGVNGIVAGNGNNTINAANSDTKIVVGNGTNNITAGNGTDVVTLGTGSNNRVTLGNGNDTVTIQTPGNHNTITTGNGTSSTSLGGGTFNTFNGGKKGNTCHLPSLPASTYNDTLTNCTAVTP
jgi:hypothetical protein